MSTGTVFVVGNGGREHAVCVKLSQSHLVEKVFVAPGNAGTAKEPKCVNVDVNVNDFEELAAWCKNHNVDLVFVGPEDPLAKGIVDFLTSQGILAFGPSAKAAEIEASKSFSKDFMSRHGIPTARYATFTDVQAAVNYIETADFPALVVKASGLAAGKGVVVADNKEGAIIAVKEILQDKSFGTAGETIVIEERLQGEEVSCLAFTDGEHVVCMPPAQDHKRLKDGDEGPNTGGMGAYCPCPLITPTQIEMVKQNVLQKAVDGLRKEDRAFKGILYAGLMLTPNGPRVLEFNCRFGDPETQVLLPLMKSDLYEVALACIHGTLDKIEVKFFEDRVAVCVVGVSPGYPGSYPKGMEIHGLPSAAVPASEGDVSKSYIIHAGTKLADDGNRVLVNGGRVLASVGVSSNLSSALEVSLQSIQCVTFDGMQFRKDIGAKAFVHSQKLASGCGGVTYADAGVNIVAGDELVNLIKPAARATTRSGCASELGLFGALFDTKAAGFKDPLLVSGTDGVGTKLMVAREVGNHSTVGEDLVAMCVNDVLCHGAEPLFFLDYYACGKLNPKEAAQVVNGIANGCKLAGCALVGGETAEMPGMYPVGEYDLAGFVVGAVEREHILPRMDDIVPGDQLIALSSSGLHSNGFSLVRRILKLNGLAFSTPAPFDPTRTLGDILLTPTRIYSRVLLPVLRHADFHIKAIAHITGGGLLENIPRVLKPELGVKLDASRWNIPNVFTWLAEEGGLSEKELCRTFNCGVGLVLIAPSSSSETLISRLTEEQQRYPELSTMSISIIGEVVPYSQLKDNTHQVEINNLPRISPSAKVLQRTENRVKVGVLISGSGTNLQALLEHCHGKNRHESVCDIAVVISNVPGVQGLQRAQAFNVPTEVISHKDYSSRGDFEKAVDGVLTRYNCQVVCLAGFMRILSPYLVQRYRGRLINVHPSLLPSFKGAHAHKLVLQAGVKLSGATVHFVVEDVDAGGIIEQGSCRVLPDDTESSLAERVKTEVEHRIFPAAMELVARCKCVLTEDNKVLWKA